MAKQVLGAPLGFFESTPVGRLIQRFSKDLDQIDQQLPSSLGQVRGNRLMFSVLCSLLLLCIFHLTLLYFRFELSQLLSSSIAIMASMIAITVVTPTFLLAMMPIFAVYVAVTNYYRNVARELKRLDSISRSPIYAHFSETLGGLPVIRSYLRQKLYRRVNEVNLDDNIAAYYAMKAVDRWLSVRLEVLGECVTIAMHCTALHCTPHLISTALSFLDQHFMISATCIDVDAFPLSLQLSAFSHRKQFLLHVSFSTMSLTASELIQRLT